MFDSFVDYSKEMTDSSEFKWNIDDPEFFSLVGQGRWDIRQAKSLISKTPREVHTFRPKGTGYESLVPSKSSSKRTFSMISIDKSRVKDADLAVPVIMIPDTPVGDLVIDGWHRITRAIWEDAEIAVVLLSAGEAQECLV